MKQRTANYKAVPSKKSPRMRNVEESFFTFFHFRRRRGAYSEIENETEAGADFQRVTDEIRLEGAGLRIWKCWKGVRDVSVLEICGEQNVIPRQNEILNAETLI